LVLKGMGFSPYINHHCWLGFEGYGLQPVH
jgi:hypothetical protein